MRVTPHPPHRSVREELPHTAPASGNDDKASEYQSASRTRPSSLYALARPCVRSTFCPSRFPLANLLPSTSSVACALFGGSSVLLGCPTSHDLSSSAYVFGLPDAASVPLRAKAVMGSPDSRARCFRACSRSTTAQEANASHTIDAPAVAFRFVPPRRLPGL